MIYILFAITISILIIIFILPDQFVKRKSLGMGAMCVTTACILYLLILLFGPFTLRYWSNSVRDYTELTIEHDSLLLLGLIGFGVASIALSFFDKKEMIDQNEEEDS